MKHPRVGLAIPLPEIGSILRREPRPGSRIVAHDYGIEGWPPTKVEKLPEIERRPGGYTHQHTIYLWRIGDQLQRQE